MDFAKAMPTAAKSSGLKAIGVPFIQNAELKDEAGEKIWN